MIFLMQSGINKKRIARALRTRAILSIFEKLICRLLIPNCTRNHVITDTKKLKKSYIIYLCIDEFSGVKR